MTLCKFTRTGETVTCSVCGSTVKFSGDEKTVHQNCGSDRTGTTASIVGSRDAPCVHLGPKLRDGTCDLCSMKGQPFNVMACAVHKECSTTKKHSNVQSCATCPGYSAPATYP